jgi:DNA-binding NarL/FixJ family response regulator
MTTRPDRLRTLLVDDHTLFREGLAELLMTEDDLEVVGRVGDSVAAVRMARQTNPHVVLLDVEMPFHPVRVTMRAIHEAAPRTRILILTMHDESRLFQELLAAGAHGVLMKTATREELVGAVRAVGYQGKTVLSVSRRSAIELAGGARYDPLTPRESEVLELAARALSNAQIAATLFIAEGTVKRHLGSVYAKLGAVSRLDAVNRARAAGLIQLAEPGAGGEPGDPGAEPST